MDSVDRLAAAGRRCTRQQRRADEAYGAMRLAQAEGLGCPSKHFDPKASHTSFYTDAVAKDKYDTLEEVPTSHASQWQS